MARDEWGFDTSEGFWNDVLGVAAAVLTIERGGELVVPAFRIKEAHSRAKVRYPNGMHLHMETGTDGGIKLQTFRAEACPHAKDEQQAGEAINWGNMETVMQGSVTTGDKRTRRIDDDTHLSPAELRQVNHAYHLLLCVALSRLPNAVLEITKEDYDAATMEVGKFGRGALSIMKTGERFSAALISDVTQADGHD